MIRSDVKIGIGAFILFAVIVGVGLIIPHLTPEEKAASNAAYQERSETKTRTSYIQMQFHVLARLNYYKDDATGLCFAMTGLSREMTMANVPCDNLTPIIFNSGE